VLEYKQVSFAYEGKAGRLSALDGLSFSVPASSSAAVIGPSGCGKSTALLLAAGLLAPNGGEVLIDGKRLAHPRLQSALILQDFGLLPWKTVYENAALGLEVRRTPAPDRRRRATQALAQVGLEAFANSYPRELSGGMRQRLALARVLALDVDLMLMDEPLSALDLLLRESMQDLLLTLWRQRHYTQLLVTHSVEEAVFLGQRIVVMSPRPGKVAAVIDNVGAAQPNYRRHPDFFIRCQEVRETLARHSRAT
jgi:NitT/TauT family transport system ATP-binding protein